MRPERPGLSVAVILAAAAAVIVASPVLATSGQRAGDAARGEHLAQRHCAACHAVGTNGESPNRLAPPFRALNGRYPVVDLIGAIGQGAATGHPVMPRFHLEFSEVQDLTAYVMSVQRPPN